MIHKYSLNGYNIILDVYSGAVHVVDDLTYRLVDFTDENMTEHAPAQAYEALCGFAREDIDAAYSELYEAFGMGQLHAADDYEQFADMMVNASVKSMCLNISHDCNLACEYCFASKGGFGGERCLMSEETARKNMHAKGNEQCGSDERPAFARKERMRINTLHLKAPKVASESPDDFLC